MSFASFNEGLSFFYWAAFILSFILGAVVNKTNFCTMGAVSDMVNMSDYGRLRAWFLAIAVAIFGVAVLEYFGMVDMSSTFPPYRAGTIVLGENIIGGFLFGVGMTLASGCGNKTLIRIGGGNIKSIIVFIIIAIIAYYMTNPFPNSDKTLYSTLFYDWISHLSISTAGQSDIGSLIGGSDAQTLQLIVGLIISGGLFYMVFKSSDFRAHKDNILSGVVVGLVVLGAWYVSSNININVDDTDYTMTSYYSEWEMVADSNEGKPASGRPLSSQSFTFINPIGQTYGYIKSGLDSATITFGLISVLGVILGSLFYALISKSFRIEWFFNLKDFVTHTIGALLMGFGGVLALGCTIGQGITGVSTLAIGSIAALISIIFGSALTMKIQYYKLVYEEEATFIKALLSSLADMKLVPSALRKLDAV